MKSLATLALVIASLSPLACTKFASPPPDAGVDAGQDATSTSFDAAADFADAATETASTSDAVDSPVAPPVDAADAADVADAADAADASDAADVGDAADAADASDAAALLALGHACSANAVCASGHCATGVCCDQACTGPCAQCSPTGACQMPADDLACGTITCPADTACRDFDSSIQANRCKSLGLCKTSADCVFADKPKGTFCGYFDVALSEAQFCDGLGTCTGPTVLCGNGGECPVSPGACCGGTTCSSNNSCSFAVFCDEATDCAPGQVCCYFVNGVAGAGGTMCTTSCIQNGNTAATQVCKLGTGECRTGGCVSSGRAGAPYFWCQ